MKTQQVLERSVHVGFGQQAVFERFRQIGLVFVEESIDAGLDGRRGAVFFIGESSCGR
jgi:hypothetical protein